MPWLRKVPASADMVKPACPDSPPASASPAVSVARSAHWKKFGAALERTSGWLPSYVRRFWAPRGGRFGRCPQPEGGVAPDDRGGGLMLGKDAPGTIFCARGFSRGPQSGSPFLKQHKVDPRVGG